MKINETFVRTSENYGINSFEVSDKTLRNEIRSFSGFSTNFNGKIKQSNYSALSPLSKELNEELKNANISLELSIDNQISPIYLNFDFAKDDCLIDNIRLKILNAIDAKIILTYTSNKKVYHNSLISIECEENSNVNCIILNDLSRESTNFLTVENILKGNSKLSFLTIDFSGEYSVTRYISNVLGENAFSSFKNMYISHLNSQIDLNIAQNLYGKNCVATIKTIGALQGKSIKNFKGMIDFKQGATKSKGNEEEYCLLLSKEAKSKALPLLCCGEEDVDGSHSSATGKIDDKELFYIMSRGIDKTEALKMLLKAKLNKVLDDVEDKNLKTQINQKIDRMIVNENRK